MPGTDQAGQAGAGNDGILAIWHDCAAGQEETFEHWYQSEHLIERVSIDGFQRGRRYHGIGGYRQYFTYYETDCPQDLTSAAYLARVNDPTPLTRQVMNGIFINPVRTVCHRVMRAGGLDGAVAVTGIVDNAGGVAAWQQSLAELLKHDGVASAELWQRVEGASDTGSREQQIRGGDETVGGCVLVSVLREPDAQTIAAWMQDRGVAAASIGTYALLCELRRRDLDLAT